LEKQVVSLELAKRLKELGVKQESVWAWYETTDRDDTPRLNRFGEHCTVCTLPTQAFEEKYYAFTVADLGEMFPYDQDTADVLIIVSGHKNNGGYFCHSDKGAHFIEVNYSLPFIAHTEADARAKMLIYLVENGLWTLELPKGV